MNRQIILFDFDGVIVDSFEGAYEVNRSFEPSLTREEMKRRFEGNINESWAEANGRPLTDEDEKYFFDRYVPALMKSPIFRGILECIKNLAENYILMVVSSSISSPIRKYLENRNAAQYFTEIMGNDIHRSKVEKIKMIFEKYGVGPGDCIFITDTLGDLREAEKAGVESIAVAWGFHDKETLSRGNPIALANKPEELIEKVSQFFGQ